MARQSQFEYLRSEDRAITDCSCRQRKPAASCRLTRTKMFRQYPYNAVHASSRFTLSNKGLDLRLYKIIKSFNNIRLAFVAPLISITISSYDLQSVDRVPLCIRRTNLGMGNDRILLIIKLAIAIHQVRLLLLHEDRTSGCS